MASYSVMVIGFFPLHSLSATAQDSCKMVEELVTHSFEISWVMSWDWMKVPGLKKRFHWLFPFQSAT